MSSIKFNEDIAKYIAEYQNISQSNLAKQLGFTQQAFSNRVKRGTLPIGALAKYCKANDIPIPLWAEQLQISEVKTDVEALRLENKELRRRLTAAEDQQAKLMAMLQRCMENCFPESS